VLYVLPQVPEDAPPEVREGIARRRLTALTGRCPCGAEAPLPIPANVPAGVVSQPVIRHEDDCLAVDRVLVSHLRRWQ
jgi:hypothetical protein